MHNDLKGKFQKAVTSLSEVKQQVKLGDYKVENFDRIQRFVVETRLSTPANKFCLNFHAHTESFSLL